MSAKIDLTLTLRGIVKKYPQFEASIYDYEAFRVDQVLTLASNTWCGFLFVSGQCNSCRTTVMTTLGLMVLTCAFFIPNALCVILGSVAMLSICTGLLIVEDKCNRCLNRRRRWTFFVACRPRPDFNGHNSYGDRLQCRLHCSCALSHSFRCVNVHKTSDTSILRFISEWRQNPKPHAVLFNTLHTVGPSVLQAGLSTVIVIAGMALVPVGMCRVVFAT